MSDLKTCTRCKATKELSEFQARTGKSYPRARCTACLSADRKQYRKENREADNAASRRWHSLNPTRQMLYSAKIRARAAGIPFTIQLSDIVIPAHCPALGIRLFRSPKGRTDNSPSLDRIVPTAGYTPSNTVVISDLANRIKQNVTPEQLQMVADWAKKVTPK